MVEKRVKKFGQGSPPPLFGAGPEKNIFFYRMASLRVSLKSADILVLDGQMSNATYLVGWRGIGLKTCNVQPAPTVSCHLFASAGNCIEEEWLPSFGLFPNPTCSDHVLASFCCGR